MGQFAFVACCILGAVWSRRQPLASAGAVLSMLDGPQGCDLAYCVVWFRFCMMRRYLAYRPAEIDRVDRLMEMVQEGCPGHGPDHSLVASAVGIWFHVGSPDAWLDAPWAAGIKSFGWAYAAL